MIFSTAYTEYAVENYKPDNQFRAQPKLKNRRKKKIRANEIVFFFAEVYLYTTDSYWLFELKIGGARY
ncbi:hypothetical protein [Dysgonomonas termitidis]|uniref:Transposase n=1 Tax=Dysgonomonas termitidis TaxID=1516126 RepID=A0ABV9KR38_9BACT